MQLGLHKVFWECNCPSGAKDSEVSASNVSLVLGDGDVLYGISAIP
jgi:hypothetical protein